MKNFWTIGVLTFLLLGCGGSNQETHNEDSNNESSEDQIIEELFLSGFIDTYPIKMYLSMPSGDGDVEGEYYYLSQRKPIELKGEKTGTHMEIQEFSKGEVNGTFVIDLNEGKDPLYTGKWTNKDNKSLDFKANAITVGEYQLGMEEAIEAKSWDEVLAMFNNEEIPISDLIPDYESEGLDSATRHQYFGTIDELEEFDWTSLYPGCKFEYFNNWILLAVYNSTPGMMGIDNDHYVLYSFDQDGNKIDEQILSCNCRDSNMGANEIYYSNVKISIATEGEINVVTENIHTNLFEEDLSEDEFFDERDTTYKDFIIKRDGKIEVYK
ncbi:hypothetical protein K6119_14460 [Paracrocinitomix mangrovi]|uniref:hypothetical protein n=1 Tax=Paracrocinitomix mangrovi TaxID=2862509 RepID=UPI001C8DA2B0|nr:hypothetical protein [Paracrocinitomix mangrovi]UKN00934.1 hypothetical protein K6119_14460 [Paracrocinitomix mangrovi]